MGVIRRWTYYKNRLPNGGLLERGGNREREREREGGGGVNRAFTEVFFF